VRIRDELLVASIGVWSDSTNGSSGVIMLARMLVVIAFVFSVQAHAQDFPNRLITMVVPFPAGGGVDIVAREIGEQLRAKWKQPVVVENRAGAGGNIGAEAVFRAKPDGYTLLVTAPGPLVINKQLYAKLNYDPDAFTQVTIIGDVANVLVVNPQVNAKSVSELIALAKTKPNGLNYASQGPGTTAHLTAELFNSMAGIRVVHVPYKGNAPAVVDLVSGQVQMMFMPLAAALELIRAGKVRALGVASEKRNALIPDVPTMSDTLPGFVSTVWFGVVVPPKTPSEIASTLSSAIAESLKQPGTAKRLAGLNIEPIGSTPAEMTTFLRQEIERWGGVMRTTGLAGTSK
jgi:tripartite-type tricarboxylate transporter receptor subunit TctC